MKIKLFVLLPIISSFSIFHSALGQGSLTPPGTPGPTMLTLSQIEPRTPISSAPITITKSGSYYLTTNLTVSSGNGIQIEANNVTLDLNGFSVSSTAPLSVTYGIYAGATFTVTNITIINGFVSGGVTNNSTGVYGGSGFGFGIYGQGQNVLVKNVSVSGCLYDGIHIAFNSSAVESCTVTTAGEYGIVAPLVRDSSAVNCGSTAISATTANNCYGQCYQTGIDCVMANNCYGYSSSGEGIAAQIANSCYGLSYGGSYGLYITYIAIGCYGYSASSVGIDSLIANSCISSGGDAGISDKYNMP